MPSKNDISSLKVNKTEPEKTVLKSLHSGETESQKPPKTERVNKGFQVDKSRAVQWDILVAKMKSAGSEKKTGPELIDEAMDYLFAKYSDY